ncbi:MAG: AAA family ATPase [Alphaproteobacteria bacterium]|nr:AAA family ATPase [Alphaproteobacteria bacterium]
MLKKLHVKDFTVFSDATFTFGALNVIHGENSSGKTHVLKLAYSIVSSLVPSPNEPASDRPTKAAMDQRVGAKLVGVFRPDRDKLGRLARRVQGTKRSVVDADFGSEGRFAFSFSTQSDRTVKSESLPSAWLKQAPAFLTTRELLSVYPGFVSLYETQAIPFDEVWRDTCVLLGAPVARGPKKKEIAALLEPLETAIGCKAVLEGDRFFVQMTNPNAKVEADLVAEGYRKLTMVARLIANGSLDDKGYLFWDEPEANLNPRLIKRLAPLLLDLAQGGVQVFIATHSLFLMREIEVERSRRKKQVGARFIGLQQGPQGVEATQGKLLTGAGSIAALDEDLQQAERILDQAMGITT